MSDIYGIAKSGLQAYKEGLATTGQNIANVGNEAYARRDAPISEVKSGSEVLQISHTAGYGVRIDGITRAFDQFIDMQLQNATSGFSFSTSQAVILDQLEQVVRPPRGQSLRDFRIICRIEWCCSGSFRSCWQAYSR